MLGLMWTLWLGPSSTSEVEMVDTVCALQDPAEQQESLEAEQERVGADQDRRAALLAARATLSALAESGRTDKTTCEAYLAAALGTDIAGRNAALVAARAGGVLSPDGLPTLPADAPIDPEEQIAAPMGTVERIAPEIDPNSPKGQALARYGTLVAKVTGCFVSESSNGNVRWISLTSLATRTSWAIAIGQHISHPERFIPWASNTQSMGVLPDLRRNSEMLQVFVRFLSNPWNDTMLTDARAAVVRWNTWLLGQLKLDPNDLPSIDLSTLNPYPDVYMMVNGLPAAHDQLPTCPLSRDWKGEHHYDR